MRDIPPRVSEELLPWVQVTPYHPQNSVNLPWHFLHSTLHLFLGGDGLGHRYIYYIIIIIKKDWQCTAGRGRLTPYQSEDPSPTLPTYRGKEEKGKIVEDKKGESN